MGQNYVLNKDVVLTINSKEAYMQTANLTRAIGEVDVTNTRSAGEYEVEGDILSTRFNYTILLKKTDLTYFTVGSKFPATWATTGGRTYSGTVMILSEQESGGVRGAQQIQGQAVFDGTTTVTS